MQATQSITRELLELFEIHETGILDSEIFHGLPQEVQASILSAKDEAARIQLLTEIGDSLPAMSEMYECYIAGPDRRESQGAPARRSHGLETTVYGLFIKDVDRDWFREGVKIKSATPVEIDGGWLVDVLYEDKMSRRIFRGIEASQSSAAKLASYVIERAELLGLLA